MFLKNEISVLVIKFLIIDAPGLNEPFIKEELKMRVTIDAHGICRSDHPNYAKFTGGYQIENWTLINLPPTSYIEFFWLGEEFNIMDRSDLDVAIPFFEKNLFHLAN